MIRYLQVAGDRAAEIPTTFRTAPSREPERSRRLSGSGNDRVDGYPGEVERWPSIKGGQPWHRLESPLEGIRLYLWKSRYRLLMNRSYRPQSHRRKHRLLLSRSPSQCGSEGRTLMSPGEERIARHLKHDGFRVGENIAYRAWRVINRGWLRSGDCHDHSRVLIMGRFAAEAPKITASLEYIDRSL